MPIAANDCRFDERLVAGMMSRGESPSKSTVVAASLDSNSPIQNCFIPAG